MVNEQGYIRPTFAELLEGRIARAKELFGEDIDTESDSPLGKFIRLSVEDLANAYEAQEMIYYSRFPSTATGQSLDRLMPFAGITRNPPTRAEHTVKFTGTAGATIEPGFLVGTTGDEEFFLVNGITLGVDGTGEGIVQCTEFGAVGNVAVGAISEIVMPVVDVKSVEHISFDVPGKDEAESDPGLRERFSVAIGGAGSGGTSAIRGAVMRITGVRSCIVEENDGDTTTESGIPPHSFEVFVYAPTSLDQEIAEAIFSKKPLGIRTFGDVSKTVLDESGREQTVNFSRVAPMPIYIKASITVNNQFQIDGEAAIKDALVGYVGGLSNGDDVIFTSLYKYIFSVPGVEDVTSLSISKDGATYAAANIATDYSQIATLAAGDIEVTLHEAT